MTLPLYELRDVIDLLKKGAEFLYRYGEPGKYVLDCFNSLCQDDQRRLLCWILTEDDKDAKAVANHLMKNLKPAAHDIKELLTQMTPDNRIEIEKLRFVKGKPTIEVSEVDRQRIKKILFKACRTIAHSREDGFWVFIPENPKEEPVREPWNLHYNPSTQEMNKLYSGIFNSSWTLHIHGCCVFSSSINDCKASTHYLEFAKHWTSVFPELSFKIKFFVISSYVAVEYTSKHSRGKRWV